jgi:hypothetical protein
VHTSPARLCKAEQAFGLLKCAFHPNCCREAPGRGNGPSGRVTSCRMARWYS